MQRRSFIGWLIGILLSPTAFCRKSSNAAETRSGVDWAKGPDHTVHTFIVNMEDDTGRNMLWALDVSRISGARSENVRYLQAAKITSQGAGKYELEFHLPKRWTE